MPHRADDTGEIHIAATPAPATRREAMLFTVEFGAPCGPPVYPGMLAGVVTSTTESPNCLEAT